MQNWELSSVTEPDGLQLFLTSLVEKEIALGAWVGLRKSWGSEKEESIREKEQSKFTSFKERILLGSTTLKKPGTLSQTLSGEQSHSLYELCQQIKDKRFARGKRYELAGLLLMLLLAKLAGMKSLSGANDWVLDQEARQGTVLDLDWKQWADARDMAFVTSDYAIGDQMWAMARRGVTWKANTQTREYQIILAPPLLEEWTWKAVNHRQADVLTLDFLKKSGSSSVLLESNDIPGFSGSPSNVRETVALRLRRSLRMFPEHRNGGPHDRQSRQGKKNRWPEKTKCVF